MEISRTNQSNNIVQQGFVSYEGAMEKIYEDTLSKLICKTSQKDLAILALRRNLLSTVLEKSWISDEQIIVCSAIAHQSFESEYVQMIEPDEEETLTSLAAVVDREILAGKENFAELTPLILLFAMYHPLKQLKCYSQLGERKLNDWDLLVRPLIQRIIVEPLLEKSLTDDILSISPITDDISQKVQKQYEENPYPRWTQLGPGGEKVTYTHRIFTLLSRVCPQEATRFGPDNFPYSGNYEVLVAGCGTGRHPLLLARECVDNSVVAVDLSRASLAYAKRMASDNGITNIHFLHGDILNIEKLGRFFPAIECAGVLHHMTDPNAGLAALRKVLAPRGLMLIGLYSERARKSVVAIRNYIAKMKMENSMESIRYIRNKIITGKMFSEYPELLKSRDLSSISGVRDVLFHVKEHRFTPLQLESMCQSHNLHFLGFIGLPQDVVFAYRKRFPKDSQMTSLSNWEIFEEEFPETFVGMFNFVCQANKTITEC